MIGRWIPLWRDARGNATIELAFMTPVLLVMSLASVDAAMGFVHRMNVQQHAQVGADYVYSKMENPPVSTQVAMEINAATGVPLQHISVTKWVECNGNKVVTPMCVLPGQAETQFIRVRVDGTYTPILNIPIYADFVRSFTHTGSVTVQVK